jgi:hypothetical protein
MSPLAEEIAALFKQHAGRAAEKHTAMNASARQNEAEAVPRRAPAAAPAARPARDIQDPVPLLSARLRVGHRPGGAAAPTAAVSAGGAGWTSNAPGKKIGWVREADGPEPTVIFVPSKPSAEQLSLAALQRQNLADNAALNDYARRNAAERF